MSTTAKRFGANLQRLRKELRHTQQDMADILQVSRASYSGWERGINEPSLDLLSTIQTHFRAPMDLMIGDKLAAARGDQWAAFRLSGVRSITQIVP